MNTRECSDAINEHKKQISDEWVVKMRFSIGITILAVVIPMAATPCVAKVYKYQKDGVWYFTDSPPREMVKQSQVMSGNDNDAPAPTQEGTPLLENYPQRNYLEKAAAATVAVKGGLGYGSGFFVSTDGYIITNKHVIRTTRDQARQEKAFFGQVDGEIESIEKEFAEEKKKLANFEAEVNGLKRLAENEKDAMRKKSYEDEYAHRHKAYQNARMDYEKRRRKFESERKVYLSKRSDYKYSQAVSNLSQGFEIVLADNTQLNVRLVATSDNQDLALLKLGRSLHAFRSIDRLL